MLVRDYMTADVVFARPGDLAREAFARMQTNHIRHMPVLDDRHHLVGILSDRDLRRPDTADDPYDLAAYYVLDANADVAHAMTGDPIVVHPGDAIEDAVQILVEKKFGALPVVDDEGTLCGILSAVDLLRAFAQLLAEVRERDAHE